MKIKDIITENWPEQFKSIERDIQGMKLVQFRDYMKSKHGINIKYKLANHPNKLSMSAYGGERRGNTIGMHLTTDVSAGTKVDDINGFMALLKHEMSHTKAPNLGNATPHGHQHQSMQGYIDYVLHPSERHSVTLDVAHILREYGMSYEQFMQIVEQTRHGIQKSGLGIEDDVDIGMDDSHIYNIKLASIIEVLAKAEKDGRYQSFIKLLKKRIRQTR